MQTNFSQLSSVGTITTSVAEPQATADASTAATFRDLLVTLMAGSMSDMGGSGAFMAPVMMLLMEKLSALDVLNSQTDQAKQVDSEVGGGRLDLNQPSGRPIQGGRLTQSYHDGHNGLDYGVVVGTPVRATMNGKVVYAGWNNQGYGNLVIVENGPYRTYYAHLSQIPVTVNQEVQAGEVIALTGNTGNSTGPHLHYEVRYNMQALNPANFGA